MPSFSRTLPDLVDAMNLYRTAMTRCIENNKIYDAVTFLFGMNSMLDDFNRVIFSNVLASKPRDKDDEVQCPKCGDKFKPSPNLAVIADSGQPIRKGKNCEHVFDYLESTNFVKGIYNIFPEIPEIKGYRNIRKHRSILYSWYNEALRFVDGAYRNYRLNYKGGSSGNE